jgi:ADP-heptose:LPS heptosyltransferase
MDDKKSKSQLDEELNEALKETFPGSDAIAIDALGDKPFRPVERRPPEIDKQLVDDLARKVKKRQAATKAR